MITKRLSDNIMLIDWLYDNINYEGMYHSSLIKSITPEHLNNAIRLSSNVEQLIRLFGIPCFASGLRYKTWGGPHLWLNETGAAIDISFPDYSDIHPLMLINRIENIPFDRIITYHKTQYWCFSVRYSNRYKLYANLPPLCEYGKPEFKSISSSKKQFDKWQSKHIHYDCDVRGINETVYSTSKKLRPHHVHISKYYTMEDMYQNAHCVVRGVNNVIHRITDDYHCYIKDIMRVFGEILDSVVIETGFRASVVRGFESINVDKNSINFYWRKNQRNCLIFALNINANITNSNDIEYLRSDNDSSYYRISI